MVILSNYNFIRLFGRPLDTFTSWTHSTKLLASKSVDFSRNGSELGHFRFGQDFFDDGSSTGASPSIGPGSPPGRVIPIGICTSCIRLLPGLIEGQM